MGRKILIQVIKKQVEAVLKWKLTFIIREMN